MNPAIEGVRFIAIGCSRGGLQAMQTILPHLPKDYDIPLAVVQHRAKDSTPLLASIMQRYTELQIVEPDDKTEIRPGTLYLAPANYHLQVESPGVFTLSVDPPVRYSRPSVDVLFETASETYQTDVIALVLTGANDDGAAGLRAVRSRGGVVIVQDPETAESPEMPRAAIASTDVDHILPLDQIGPFLAGCCGPAKPGA